MGSLDEMEGDEEGLVRPCGLGDTYWGFWARIMRWVIVPGWGRGGLEQAPWVGGVMMKEVCWVGCPCVRSP